MSVDHSELVEERRHSHCRCLTRENGYHDADCPEHPFVSGIKAGKMEFPISSGTWVGRFQIPAAAIVPMDISTSPTVKVVNDPPFRQSQTTFPWRCENVLSRDNSREYAAQFQQEFRTSPRPLDMILRDAVARSGSTWLLIYAWADGVKMTGGRERPGDVDRLQRMLSNLLYEAFASGESNIVNRAEPVFRDDGGIRAAMNERIAGLEALRDRQQAEILELKTKATAADEIFADIEGLDDTVARLEIDLAMAIEWAAPAAWAAFCAFFPAWRAPRPSPFAKRWDDGPGMVRT
jgi:hypothetical protein